VLLNAAAVLVAAGVGDGSLVEQFALGLHHCADAVDTGRARATLERWVRVSQRVYSSNSG
jgi:anthranilate phosphoribosyltransferase